VDALADGFRVLRPAVRAAWEDVVGCAVQAFRVIYARPRLLWPAAVLAAIAIAAWPARIALTMPLFDRLGMSFWEALAGHRPYPHAPFSFQSEVSSLYYALPDQPGGVARHLWVSTGADWPLAFLVGVGALAALVVTSGSWRPVAAARGAEPSARLLHWLVVPLLILSAGGIYFAVAQRGYSGTFGGRDWRFLANVLVSLPPALAYGAAVRGAVLTAARRATRAEDPWSAREIAWGALCHFRGLFLLAAWFAAAEIVWSVLLQVHPDQAMWNQVWLLLAWAGVALLLAPAIIVSEGVGAVDGARLALRAWRRAPWHLAMVIVLGVTALWVFDLLQWAAGRGVDNHAMPIGLSFAVVFLRLALYPLVTIWAAAVALLLWRRVRGRVMVPAS